MVCDTCGAENRAGSRFCDQCGSTLASACPACGAANRPDARFCSSCGTALAGDAAPPHGAALVPPPRPSTPAAPRSPEPSAERRLVSVLFTDLVGFTTYAEDRDPEAVRELLSRYFATATEIIERHGGTVEKFIGDAVMAVWGTPTAHEDDAERSVRTALELVDAVRSLAPGLQARSGILTGEAAVTIGATNQGMVAGDLVNTAARLQGVAEPGTVLVGEATMRAASRAIVFESLGDRSVKGKTTPVPAWRALRVVAARGGQGRADALEAPFVGRDEELRQLKEQLHVVGRERRVRLVSITGPGGIGKSRLVWELEKYVDGVSETIWWHRGRSPSYGEGVAFWALGEMVRRRATLTEDDDEPTTRQRIDEALVEYVPDPSEQERIRPALLSLLGIGAPPAGGREALFPAWRLFFERIADRGTTVLVFEDLQWADTGLLDFIDHLIDWSRGRPIMVVTLARPELFDRRPDWGGGRRQFTGLALDPLSDDDVRRLLEGLVPGLPDAATELIVRRAEGIPLYAVETVRSLLADEHIERVGDVYRPVGDLSQLSVPESLRSLIASRLDSLDPADRALLQDASVLGQVFSAETLAAVTGIPEADVVTRLRHLARREVLDVETDPRSPERGQYKFLQSLIREVAYGMLARRDRRRRHLAVARNFEAVGDDELAGALASHYLAAHAASDPGAEADAIASQARLALGAAANRAAALGAHDEAVAHVDQALGITREPRDRAALLDLAARSASAAARPDAERYATEALAAQREQGDAVGIARALGLLGVVLIQAGEVARAVSMLETAREEAEAAGSREVLAEVLAHLSRGYMRAVRLDDAIATADRALAVAELLNHEDAVAEALVNKGSALGLAGRWREGSALLEAAVELADRHAWWSLATRARNNLGSVLGDEAPARSTQIGVEALELARQLGDQGQYLWLVADVAQGRFEEGSGWDEAVALLAETLEGAKQRYDRGRLLTFLAIFAAARGEPLERPVEEMLAAIGGSEDPDELLGVATVRAEAAVGRGDLREAYRQGMSALNLATQIPEAALWIAARAAVWARDLAMTREAAAALAGLPRSGALSRTINLHLAAAIAALEGRPVEALVGFREARQAMQRLGQGFAVARFAIDASVLLPDEPEVRAWAAEARTLLEELGARPYLERLDAALAAGGRPTTEAAARPVSGDAAPVAG